MALIRNDTWLKTTMNERTTIYAKLNPVSIQTCLIHGKICIRFDNPYQLSRYHSKKVYI